MFRFDYVKLWLVVDEDRFQQVYSEVAAAYLAHDPEANGSDMKVRSYGERIQGKRAYSIELWGERCACVRSLFARTYLKHLNRIDVVAISPHIRDERVWDLFERCLHEQQRFNVQRFSSRARTKRGGQSAGGTGWALGSHKSTRRLTIYRKHGSPWRVEIQLTGQTLHRAAHDALHWADINGATNPALWDEFMWGVWAHAGHMLAPFLGDAQSVLDALEAPF